MEKLSKEQIRYFRLHTHHLDTFYLKADAEAAAGAFGFQNSPPGAWETALFNRIPDNGLPAPAGRARPLSALEVEVTPWGEANIAAKAVLPLIEEYAAFRQLSLRKLTFL